MVVSRGDLTMSIRFDSVYLRSLKYNLTHYIEGGCASLPAQYAIAESSSIEA